ncbi:MAG: hypothetical protein NVS3B19_02540 [Ginsengibacter sp.]
MLLGGALIVFLCAGVSKQSSMICKNIDISIHGVQNNVFIDEKDVEKILYDINDGPLVGKKLKDFDLMTMQKILEQNDWIRKAQLYFDNNENLWVNIIEREPIARIFTRTGNTFYLDTSNIKIPLSNKFSARLPVFTNFPDTLLTRADTNLLADIKNISQYIRKDSFWMAQVDQVDITNERKFEIIPKIGNQVIVFGNGERYEEKFHFLLLLYRDVLSKVGWNKYSKINVEYTGQIVTVKRGFNEVKIDSIKTAEIMKAILMKAQTQLLDSTGVQLTQKDDYSQQVIPLVNEDLPDENISLIPGLRVPLVGNLKSLFKDTTNKKNNNSKNNDSVLINEKKKLNNH